MTGSTEIEYLLKARKKIVQPVLYMSSSSSSQLRRIMSLVWKERVAIVSKCDPRRKYKRELEDLSLI